MVEWFLSYVGNVHVYCDPAYFFEVMTGLMSHFDVMTKRCFCGEVAHYRCDWPVEKFVMKDARELQEGDHIRSNEGQYAVVINVETIDPLKVAVTVQDQWKTRNAVHWHMWPVNAGIDVLCETSCRNPVCEAHVRELSETKHVCVEHWRAQLAAIA